MSNTIYREQMMELYSERPNFGSLQSKTHEIKMKNPVCNDEIKLELEIKDGKIIDAKFSGKTCFISTISASMLMEKIKGMKLSEIKKLNKQDIDNMLGTEIISTRAGCELFPLDALKMIK